MTQIDETVMAAVELAEAVFFANGRRPISSACGCYLLGRFHAALDEAARNGREEEFLEPAQRMIKGVYGQLLASGACKDFELLAQYRPARGSRARQSEFTAGVIQQALLKLCPGLRLFC